MRTRHLVFALTALMTSSLFAEGLAQTEGTRAEVSSPAAQYVETILVALDHIEQNLPLITQYAEQVAERLVAGSDLYVTSDEPGFSVEPVDRAGGMAMLRQSAPGATVKDGVT